MSAHETPPPTYSVMATTYNSPGDIQGTNNATTPHPGGTDGSPLHIRGAGDYLGPVDDGGLPEVVTPVTSAPDKIVQGIDQTSEKQSHVQPIPRSGSMYSQPVASPGSELSPTMGANSAVSFNNSNSVHDDSTVTPLHLLTDQSDWVDCPFCRRRVETRVKKEPSVSTHAATASLYLLTLGAGHPARSYVKKWKCHVTHICTNCDRKVAHQPYGKPMEALGTPEHLRQVSRYQTASPGMQN